MKHRFVITVDTPNAGAALHVREEAVGAVEDFIESRRPDFNIDCGSLIDFGSENDLAVIEAARQEHESEGTLEIDDNATVSYSSDGGAYVQAWVWVGDSEINAKGGINPETAGEEGEKK